MTLIKYEASIELLSTTPVNQLLKSALTITAWMERNKISKFNVTISIGRYEQSLSFAGTHLYTWVEENSYW